MCECNVVVPLNESICNDCHRSLCCDFPCPEFEEQRVNYVLKIQQEAVDSMLRKYAGIEDPKKVELNSEVDDFVESLLGYNVSMFLQKLIHSPNL